VSGSSASRTLLGLHWQAIAVAGVAIAALLLLAPAYGWHRDELYFVVAGRHPALGYVDQPPLTPLLSAGMVALLGPSPVAVRILPALAFGAIVLLAALAARDFGGSRRAQALAALVVAISALLAGGHLDSTATYDLLAWALVLWLAVRLLAGADPRLWLLVGLVAGIGLENKHIILFLGAGLAGGLLLARRWDVVRSPWAWGALGLAILIWLPNLAWQAANGFPQVEMAAAIAEDGGGDRAMVAVELALFAGPLLFPVALAGAWWLLASPAARPWRALGYAAVLVFALVLLVGGKSYYAAGVLPLLIAAGALTVDGWLARGRTRLRGAAFGAAAAVSGVLAAVLVLPIVPPAELGSTPIPELYGESAEQIGWPELVATVEGAVADLPADERARAAIITSNYGEAGALELLGRDLPPVHSGHNGYWDWGPPPDDRTIVVTVGWDPAEATRPFEGCGRAVVIDNGVGVDNQEQGRLVLVCRDLRRPWSTAWPDFRHLD
jgi:hypothetical protein